MTGARHLCIPTQGCFGDVKRRISNNQMYNVLTTDHEIQDIALGALNYLMQVVRSRIIHDFVACAEKMRRDVKKQYYPFSYVLRMVLFYHGHDAYKNLLILSDLCKHIFGKHWNRTIVDEHLNLNLDQLPKITKKISYFFWANQTIIKHQDLWRENFCYYIIHRVAVVIVSSLALTMVANFYYLVRSDVFHSWFSIVFRTSCLLDDANYKRIIFKDWWLNNFFMTECTSIFRNIHTRSDLTCLGAFS